MMLLLVAIVVVILLLQMLRWLLWMRRLTSVEPALLLMLLLLLLIVYVGIRLAELAPGMMGIGSFLEIAAPMRGLVIRKSPIQRGRGRGVAGSVVVLSGETPHVRRRRGRARRS